MNSKIPLDAKITREIMFHHAFGMINPAIQALALSLKTAMERFGDSFIRRGSIKKEKMV